MVLTSWKKTQKRNKQTENNIISVSDKGWEENKTECCERGCLVAGRITVCGMDGILLCDQGRLL